MFEDHGSTRIDLACPHCRQLFKVRLRKLQFGADLTCRLCRHEFPAEDVSGRPEVQGALARMHRIVEQRARLMKSGQARDVTGNHDEKHSHPEARMKLLVDGSEATGEAFLFEKRTQRNEPPLT